MKLDDAQAPLVVFGGLLIAFGISSLIKQLYYLRLAIRTQSWKKVVGHLIAVADRPLNLAPGRGRVPNPTVAIVRYHYKVGDANYESSAIGYHGVWKGTDAEYAHVHRTYGHHGPVNVWYDPDQPARAVLEPGPGASSYVRVGISLALLTAGGILLALGAIS